MAAENDMVWSDFLYLSSFRQKTSKNAENRPIFGDFRTIFGNYLGNEAKYKKSGRTMTFAAAKLVRVQIFVSIGKAIAKKNEDGRTDGHTDTHNLFLYI